MIRLSLGHRPLDNFLVGWEDGISFVALRCCIVISCLVIFQSLPPCFGGDNLIFGLFDSTARVSSA